MNKLMEFLTSKEFYFCLCLIALYLLSLIDLQAQEDRSPCNGAWSYEIVHVDGGLAWVQLTAENDAPGFMHKWFVNGILAPDTIPDPIYVIQVTPSPIFRVAYCNECDDDLSPFCEIDCSSCRVLWIWTSPTQAGSQVYGQGIPIGTPILIGNVAGQGVKYDYYDGYIKPGELIYKILRP